MGGVLSLWTTPAAVGLEIGIEEDPLASEVVPQGGEVPIRSPTQGWPGWTPLHPGGRAQLEVPVDPGAVAQNVFLLLLL